MNVPCTSLQVLLSSIPDVRCFLGSVKARQEQHKMRIPTSGDESGWRNGPIYQSHSLSDVC